ncbi:HYDIN protein, partial [Centropus unirufus]|nr:HYDIN protein [Centropus unirufus]
QDYFHQLTCITERDMFNVPIRAIGARAILDFPDRLNFSTCPVKYSTQKTLLVHNFGNQEARYRISTQSLTVTLLCFVPGENIHTSLYGTAVDVDIGLDRSSLTIEKTFLSLANRSSVVLYNRSKITAHFQWKTLATPEEEDQKKLRLCHRMQRLEDNKTYFCYQDKEASVLPEDVPVLSYILQNMRAKAQSDPMLFSDDVFTIDPMEGDIFPNSSIEINVTFKPQEALDYERTAYCSISGREATLPLHIKGEGIGPQVQLSFEELDVGNVFIGTSHKYEVILLNKGAIDAPFKLLSPPSALGIFTLFPQEGIISPGGLQVIKISFNAAKLGKFKK